MARILGLFPSALGAANRGATATEWYRELRVLGIAPRQSEAYRLFGVARGIISRSAAEPFRNQNAVPTRDEIGQWPSKNATGIAQTVTLAYRDKVTGQIKQTWWRTVTPTGVTRARATAMAITAYSDTAERYGQELIGAVHTSANELIPGLV
jgi:hypothetical protein